MARKMDRQTKRSITRCNSTASRTRFITTNVMNGIWSKHLDYSTPVSKAHWMDSAYLCPVIVIAYKYQIRKLVMYDNSGTDTNSVELFMTNPNVKYPLKTIPGFIHNIGASGNVGVVFFCDQSHFLFTIA